MFKMVLTKAGSAGPGGCREVRSVGSGRWYFGFRYRRRCVNPLARTLIVALLTFASGLLGFFLQWLLPVQEVAGARNMIGSIIGFVTLLLALVLGLLVWTTYGVYTNQNAESQSLGCARRSCARAIASGVGAAGRAA